MAIPTAMGRAQATGAGPAGSYIPECTPFGTLEAPLGTLLCSAAEGLVTNKSQTRPQHLGIVPPYATK